MVKCILITGGAGYAGYTITEELSSKFPDYKIVIFDNFSKGKLEGIGLLAQNHKNIEIIPWEKADIRDNENVENAFEQYKPEIVVHLAAIVDAFTTNREGKDRECEIVNYNSAVSVAKIAKKHGCKIFIFQCTVSIYSRGEELTEDSPKEPLSTYGKSKMKAEIEILELNDEKLKVVSLRPATIVGYNPCFRYETIINLACIRAVYKVPINIFESALKGEKTFLTLKDNAKAIIFSIENIEKMKGNTFNITSYHANLENVLTKIKENLKEEFPYFITPQKSISQQVYTINSDKIKKIGFKPEGTLEETINETVSSLKNVKEFYKKFNN